MTTILFLLVIFNGDVRYYVERHPNLTECRFSLQLATDEFREHQPQIKTIRAECIEVGKPA